MPGMKATEHTTAFDFFPDRDSTGLFSMRVPIEVVSSTEADSINVMIRNDHGHVCAEKTSLRDLEIRGLPCDQCMQGKLHVTIEPKNQSQILSRTQTIVLDDSRRTEICELRAKHRLEGENMRITSTKRRREDGCKWLFRDESGYIGCCYSNRDYYKQSGGCDPDMQSTVCREGSEIPIIKEEGNSCTLYISNLGVKDSGNYLTNYDKGAPTFKTYLVVSVPEEEIEGVWVILLGLGLAGTTFLIGIAIFIFDTGHTGLERVTLGRALRSPPARKGQKSLLNLPLERRKEIRRRMLKREDWRNGSRSWYMPCSLILA
jgi:hypothetical protein